MTRFLVDETGRLHARRLFFVGVGSLVMALFGTVLLVGTPVLNGYPAMQTAYVIFCVFALKLPLVILCWWLIMRNQEWPGRRVVWSPSEVDEILAHLVAEAGRARDRPDELARLTYLSGEAWHVADEVGGEAKVDALTVALRIDERMALVRARADAGSAGRG